MKSYGKMEIPQNDEIELLTSNTERNTPADFTMTFDSQIQDLHSQSQEGVASVLENEDMQESLSSESTMNSPTSQNSNLEEPPKGYSADAESTSMVDCQRNKSCDDTDDSDVICVDDFIKDDDIMLKSHSFHNTLAHYQETEEISRQTDDLAVEEAGAENHTDVLEPFAATNKTVLEPSVMNTSIDFIKTHEQSQETQHKIVDEESDPKSESNSISTVEPIDNIEEIRAMDISDIESMTYNCESTYPLQKEESSLSGECLSVLTSSLHSLSRNSSVSKSDEAILLTIDHNSSENDIEKGIPSTDPEIPVKMVDVDFDSKSTITRPVVTRPVVIFASGSHVLISSRSSESKEEKSILSESTAITSSTFGTLYTLNTMGTAITLGIDPLLKGDDAGYMVQRYGFINLILTVAQLFSLTMTLSLCGFAPFAFNYGLGPYADALSQTGALNPYLFIEDKQYWRVFTAPLMTSSLLHFFVNGFFQLEAGAFLEREWGTLRWFIIYMFSAFGATIFSCIFAPNVVSVTSSSALFGVLGAKYSEFLMVLNFRTKQNRIRRDYYIQQIKVIVCISMAILSMCLFSYVEVSGVLGGFMFGFASGMILLYSQLMKREDKILWAGTGLSLMVLLLIGVWFMLKKTKQVEELEDVCNYYESIHYEGYYCQCLI